MTAADLTLLPCPFCGGEADHSMGKRGDDSPWPYVECIKCGATTEPDQWNRRSPAVPAGCVARESEEEAREVLAGRLIDAWCHDKGKKIPWAKAVQIIAIVTKQSDEERDRLLRLGDEGGACGMCGRTDQLSAGPPTADQPGEQTDHDCVPKPGIHK